MEVFVVLEQEYYGNSTILSIYHTEKSALNKITRLLEGKKYTKGTWDNSWDVDSLMKGYRIERHYLKD